MKQLIGNKKFSSATGRASKILILAAMAVLVVGCGGGGGDEPAARSTTSSGSSSVGDVFLGVVCFLVTNGQPGCLEDDEPPPTAPVPVNRPHRLFAEEPVGLTVTINWLPPDESWEGLPAPFVSGYVIYISEQNSSNGFWYGVEKIHLDDPGLLTYVVDMPGPGRWHIRMTAVSNYSGNESASTGYLLVYIDVPDRPDPPVIEAPLDSAPGSRVVTLDWVPPSQNEDGTPLLDLTGHNVYFGSLSGIYTDFRVLDNPGLVTYVLDLPSSGSWFIAITALAKSISLSLSVSLRRRSHGDAFVLLILYAN